LWSSREFIPRTPSTPDSSSATFAWIPGAVTPSVEISTSLIRYPCSSAAAVLVTVGTMLAAGVKPMSRAIDGTIVVRTSPVSRTS